MKKENWQECLNDFIEKSRYRKFKRGHFDCALFAGYALEAMTDKDFTQEFVGEYKTYKEAIQVLKKLKYKDLEDIADKKLNVLTNVSFAGRGDIVLVCYEDDHALAVVDMTGRSAMLPGLNGLVFFDRSYWLKGWFV